MSDKDMLSEDDDYELDDEDDEGDTSFSIRDPLNPPRAQPWSTSALHHFMHAGLIDPNPPYQRDVVWPEAKQVGLIDSIFRNFYIPPVIFTVEKDEETGEEIRVCVDGKQRLTSIQRFIDGMIPHRDPITKKKYWFTRSDTQPNRLLLPAAYRKQFQNKQITCVEYTDLPAGTERDIFQRVQLGMSLTAAEKLQAIASSRTKWVSDIQMRYINAAGGLCDSLNWVASRGRDFQGVAQLCYCCWNLPSFSSPTVAKLEKWLLEPEDPSPKFKKQVKDVLERFLHLAEDHRKGFTGIKERVAPVEFLFIGLLLVKMRRCDLKDCAEQVLAMRKHTRSLYKDIRSNSTVMKTMWEYIDHIYMGDVDPFDDWEGPGSERADATKKKNKAASKRKRKDGDGDGSSDEVVRPKAPRAAPKPRTSHGNGVQFVA